MTQAAHPDCTSLIGDVASHLPLAPLPPCPLLGGTDSPGSSPLLHAAAMNGGSGRSHLRSLPARCLMAAVGHDSGAIALTDLGTGRVVGSLDPSHDGHHGPVFAVTMCPNGRWLLSCSEDGTVKCWSLARKEVLRSLDLPGSVPVHSLCIAADSSRFVCGSHDGRIRVYPLDPIDMVT